MNNMIEQSELIERRVKIKDMIYEIGGVQVILGKDLAFLYNCANVAKDINKALKRNIEKNFK